MRAQFQSRAARFARRALVPVLALLGALGTSACYYGPYGYYPGYGYAYAPAPVVTGGVVVGGYPRYYYR